MHWHDPVISIPRSTCATVQSVAPGQCLAAASPSDRGGRVGDLMDGLSCLDADNELARRFEFAYSKSNVGIRILEFS